MSTNAGVDDPIREQYTTNFVTSKDGTTIGYRQYGHGPGIVLVQGAMGSAQNFNRLAELLADAFTVYVPDRRGRGLSDLPYRGDYTVAKDVEDLDAVLTKTGTHAAFGLSAGALIVLEAARELPAIHKIALYEPALFPNRSLPAKFVARFDREMAQGRVAAALVTAMKGAQMGPPIANLMPRFLLESLTNSILRSEDRNGSGEYLSMRQLAPALHYDFEVVVEMSGRVERFRSLPTDVLLLGGSKSPKYLKAALDDLKRVLPHVTRIEFPGLTHGSAWNYEKQRNPDGKPEVVAQALRRFFGEPQS